MKDIIEISLAGFLHDWGKLFQRAETKLSDQANRMKEMLCPTYGGRPSHFHVLHTNDILENHLNWLPTSLDRARIIGTASRHHRPADPEDWIIAEADRLASGHDRREKAEEQRDYKSVPLDSVFSSLRLSANGQRRRRVLLPDVLRADESLFPDPPSESDRLVGQYNQVAKRMIERLAAFCDIPEHRLCDTLASLSESTLARIPASTIDAVCDVSLHDHSAAVAAFAAALFAYHRETDTVSESAIRDRSVDKFILLGGDLSGIQRYLFDMPREGVKVPQSLAEGQNRSILWSGRLLRGFDGCASGYCAGHYANYRRFLIAALIRVFAFSSDLRSWRRQWWVEQTARQSDAPKPGATHSPVRPTA